MSLFRKKKKEGEPEAGKKQITILVVEDDEDMARYQKFLLEENGYRVLVAHKGGEGLELARKKVPDLALLDINLPTISGFQMCRELKNNEKTKHIPIIMVSAQDKMSDYVRAAQEGAEAYVGKPINKDELLDKIRKHLL